MIDLLMFLRFRRCSTKRGLSSSFRRTSRVSGHLVSCGIILPREHTLIHDCVTACPPYHLAVVIGGTSAELTLKTVKMASTKYLDDLPTTFAHDTDDDDDDDELMGTGAMSMAAHTVTLSGSRRFSRSPRRWALVHSSAVRYTLSLRQLRLRHHFTRLSQASTSAMTCV